MNRDDWIKVGDELPDMNVGVLVTNGTNVVTAERCTTLPMLFAKGWHWSSHGFGGYDWEWDFDTANVTHWMPLPDLPV